jgi:hypothetical protein
MKNLIRNLFLAFGLIIGFTILAAILSVTAGERGAAIMVGILFLAIIAIPTSLAIALLNRTLTKRSYTKHVHNDNRQIIVFVQMPNGEYTKVEGEEAKRLLSGLPPRPTSVIVSKPGNASTSTQERF